MTNNKSKHNKHNSTKGIDYQSKTILVTGGAGFLGSNFIRFVLSQEEDSQVINLDKLTYAGNLKNLKGVKENYPERYKFVRGDICNRSKIEEVFRQERPDTVVNFAAETHVDRSFEKPQHFIRTNVEGVGSLLEVARKMWGLDIKGNKFLHMSTDKVYGSLPVDKLKQKFTEDDQLNPSSPYAASKAGADHVVQSYKKSFGLPVSVVRSTNVFGPYQYPEKLIPLMVYRAKADNRLPVYGDGKNMREWIFVKDVCTALRAVLNNGKPGEIYNVGSGEEHKNIEVVKKILDYLGKPETLIYYTEERPVHDRRCAIDTTKIQERTGWSPQSYFGDKLEETIDWYLNNTDWVKSITKGGYKDWIESNYENL